MDTKFFAFLGWQANGNFANSAETRCPWRVGNAGCGVVADNSAFGDLLASSAEGPIHLEQMFSLL